MEPNCTEAEETVTNPYYRAVLILHVLLSGSAIVFTIGLQRFFRQKIYFHKNLKILIACMFFFALLLSVQMFLMQGMHLVLSIFASPCNMQLRGSTCLPFVAINGFASGCMCAVQFAMCIERIVATKLIGSYQKRKWHIGAGLAVSAILVFTSLIYETFASVTDDEYLISCLTIPTSIADKANRDFMIMLVVNIITLIVLFVIYVINKRWRKRMRFHLNDRYQIEENIATSEMICVVLLVQFVVFTIYGSATLALRLIFIDMNALTRKILLQLAYTVPFFTFALPLVMRHVVLRGISRRGHRIDVMVKVEARGVQGGANYFDELLKQWS